MPVPKYTALARLLALVVFMAAGCNFDQLFKNDGAPCIGDANCPDNQVCCSGRCKADCLADGPIVVSVMLATDYVPFYEFESVTVDLDGDQHTIAINAVTELAHPRTISQFGEVPRGHHLLTVMLTLGGTITAQRVTTFTSNSDITIELAITRDCATVTCSDASLDQCVGGQCVSRSCSSADPTACPPAACSTDGDCTPTNDCSIATCIDGLCMHVRQDSQCAADERCIPDRGCIAAKPECTGSLQCDDLTSCTVESCDDARCNVVRDDTRCGATVCDPTAKNADSETGCTEAPCSLSTCTPGSCEIASCVDDICNHTIVCESGEQCCRDGTCSSSCDNPTPCAGRGSDYLCRRARGGCDIDDYCDGVSDTCIDHVIASGTECKKKGGDCDESNEVCDGASYLCPNDELQPAGFQCRAVDPTKPCDIAETCNGQSPLCPQDVPASPADNKVCRAAANDACDVVEHCNGDFSCPTDTFKPSSTVCHSSEGACDNTTYCPGNGPNCPGSRLSSASSCAPPQQTGPCDAGIYCDGSNASCPATHTYYGTSQICHAAGASPVCDPAVACDGSQSACPAVPYPQTGYKLADIDTCSYSGCASDHTVTTFPQNEDSTCASHTICLANRCVSGTCTGVAVNDGVSCGAACYVCSNGSCVNSCPSGWYCTSSGGSTYCTH